MRLLASGDLVIIHSLQTHAHLNGRAAEVLHDEGEGQRVAVVLLTGDSSRKAIRRQNITRVDGGQVFDDAVYKEIPAEDRAELQGMLDLGQVRTVRSRRLGGGM